MCPIINNLPRQQHEPLSSNGSIYALILYLRFNVNSYNGNSYNGSSSKTATEAARTTAARLMNWVVERQLVSNGKLSNELDPDLGP
jgi:hypothetical protein